MTREGFWLDSYLWARQPASVLKHENYPPEYTVEQMCEEVTQQAASFADDALAEFDKRFGKQQSADYSYDNWPSFDQLEDGVDIAGLNFVSWYDSANKNWAIRAHKKSKDSCEMIGTYYSNCSREEEFVIWWRDFGHMHVKIATEDAKDENSDS